MQCRVAFVSACLSGTKREGGSRWENGLAAFHAFLYVGSKLPFEGRGQGRDTGGAKAFKWGMVRRGIRQRRDHLAGDL
jgi:hypothetical protein